MKRKVKIIKIDKKTFRKFVDHMVLEAENDKEFKEALKWLDRTKLIKGDFYDKVFQMVFQLSPTTNGNISRSRMDSFMKSLTRNDK
jgi:hypothetical protein